jgi:uncharacterized membrane protein YjgN (DUF898 family)
MALMTLACPHCGFSKELEQGVLPPAGATVTCPKCRGQFPLGTGGPRHPAELAPAGPLPLDAPDNAPTSLERVLELHEPPPSSAPPSDAPPGEATDAPPERPRTLSFCFTGSAKEYFGIWIVNTLLRVVTFGLYSPWAKVRKRRYFYGNTLLDDAPFDYLADPWAILKGWFIAGLFFGLYSFASRTSPLASAALGLIFMGLYPWVIVRSRIFSLRNSSHRNIRFSFAPNYGEAYKVFLWWSLLLPLSLGFLAPYLVYRQKRFLVENSSFGTTPFQFHATVKQYYRAFLPVLVLLPLAAAALGATYLLSKGTAANPALMAAGIALFFAAYLAGMLYLPVALSNLTWSATSIGRHRFACTLRVRDLAWIYLSNALAVLCSFGLLAPWAAIRLARYRIEKMSLTGFGRLDTIIAAEQEAMGATGEELGDMLGFDFGL